MKPPGCDEHARKLYLQGVRHQGEVTPESHSFRASVLELTSTLELDNGNFTAALPMLEQAVEIESKNFLPTSMRRIEAVIQLAEAQNRLGKGDEAEETIESVLEDMQLVLPDHPLTSLLRVHHAHAALVKADVASARERLNAVSIDEKGASAHAQLLRARAGWIEALVLHAENDVEGAATVADRAMQATRSLSGLHQVYLRDLQAIVRPTHSS